MSFILMRCKRYARLGVLPVRRAVAGPSPRPARFGSGVPNMQSRHDNHEQMLNNDGMQPGKSASRRQVAKAA